MFQGETYEYTVLPFGLSLSARVFIKCMEATLSPIRQRGIRLATYLDDWLLLVLSCQRSHHPYANFAHPPTGVRVCLERTKECVETRSEYHVSGSIYP